MKYLSPNKLDESCSDWGLFQTLDRHGLMKLGIDENKRVSSVFYSRLPTAATLFKLQLFTHLIELNISDVLRQYSEQVDTSFVDAICLFPRFKRLLIQNIPISVGACKLLAQSSITELRLRSCYLTDEHLKHLRDMQQLQSITIADNSMVTARGVEFLLSSSNLESLYLDEFEYDEKNLACLKGHRNHNAVKLLGR